MSRISHFHNMHQDLLPDSSVSTPNNLWTPPEGQLPSIWDLFSQEVWFKPYLDTKEQDYFSYKTAKLDSDEKFHNGYILREIRHTPSEPLESHYSDSQTTNSGAISPPATPDTDEDVGVYTPNELTEEFQRNQPNYIAKRHICHLCHKRFPRPSSLRVHLHTHTGEKPYVCEFANCQRRFSVLSNLRRHYKTHL